MPQNLIPHTQEWFDAFYKINPVQTELTKRLMKRAGHADICTTCGDNPIGDYIVQMFPFITLRLCPPCLDIYTATYGTQLKPVGEVPGTGEASASDSGDSASAGVK